MGIDITYRAGESELSFRLPQGDIEVLEYLRKKYFPKEIEVIFGVDDFGEIKEINRHEILKAIEITLNSMKQNKNILPYNYITKSEISRGSGIYSGGGGIISGFKIKGEIYSLEAGLDKCILTKRKQVGDKKWCDCEPKDVRNIKIIKTDKDCFFGDIQIKKKRKPTKLIKNLEQLKTFLSNIDEKMIQKILG